jgi:hypothetical protein
MKTQNILKRSEVSWKEELNDVKASLQTRREQTTSRDFGTCGLIGCASVSGQVCSRLRIQRHSALVPVATLGCLACCVIVWSCEGVSLRVSSLGGCACWG